MTRKVTRDAERSCRERLADLFAFLDGELTPSKIRRVERHLASCQCCGTLTDNLRKAMLLYREEGQRPVSAALRSRARRRVTALLADARLGDAGVAASSEPPVSRATSRPVRRKSRTT